MTPLCGETDAGPFNMEELADIPTSGGDDGRDVVPHPSVELKTRASSPRSEVFSIEATSRRPCPWEALGLHIEAFCADYGDER
eukprot:s1467_g16.t1